MIIYKYLLLFLLIIATSCGGVKIDPSLSEDDARAITYVDDNLQPGYKIVDYQILHAPKPAVLYDNRYKHHRDMLNKSRIDYYNAVRRGLEKHAEINIARYEAAMKMVMDDVKYQSSNPEEYIIILASTQEYKREKGKLTGIIVLFDPAKKEAVEWREITLPIYNTALMIAEAEKEIPASEAILLNHDAKELREQTDDPVLKFVLSCYPK